MGGRVKRTAGLAQSAARAAERPVVSTCALCERPLGIQVEHHHAIPKSQGGTVTVPVHPICHRTIHAFITNRDLATCYATMDRLRDHDDIRRYLRWIADKPPNFRAPTRRRTSP